MRWTYLAASLRQQGPESVAYGFLPAGFFKVLHERLKARRRQALVRRSE